MLKIVWLRLYLLEEDSPEPPGLPSSGCEKLALQIQNAGDTSWAQVQFLLGETGSKAQKCR